MAEPKNGSPTEDMESASGTKAPSSVAHNNVLFWSWLLVDKAENTKHEQTCTGPKQSDWLQNLSSDLGD